MQSFTKDRVIVLPHAEEYRKAYVISLDEIRVTLNEPELHEGFTNERFTAEKTIGNRRIYLYYYQILPFSAHQDEYYAIVDFIGYSSI